MSETIRAKYERMNVGLSREEITRRAVQAMKEIREASERNGLSNMTLEEINAEIYAARREMELRETEARLL